MSVRAATRDKTRPPRKREAQPPGKESHVRAPTGIGMTWPYVSVHSQVAESFLSLPPLFRYNEFAIASLFLFSFSFYLIVFFFFPLHFIYWIIAIFELSLII